MAAKIENIKDALFHRIAPRSYTFQSAVTALRTGRAIRRNLRREYAVLVYTMGKVGSRTIGDTIRSAEPGFGVYHVHFLTKEQLDLREEGVRSDFRRLNKLKFHVVVGQHFRKLLEGGLERRRLRIVTAVRDPVSTHISSFFHLLYRNPLFDYREIHREDLRGAVKKLTGLYLEDLSPERVTRWFDFEMKAALGLDVYAAPFPRERGYAIYRGDHPDTLLIKAECLDTSLPDALREFFGKLPFSQTDSNRARDKDYHRLYTAFRREIRLPRQFLDSMYSSPYARHFYSDDEISRFRGHWKVDPRTTPL